MCRETKAFRGRESEREKENASKMKQIHGTHTYATCLQSNENEIKMFAFAYSSINFNLITIIASRIVISKGNRFGVSWEMLLESVCFQIGSMNRKA